MGLGADKPSPFHFQASPAILISIVLAAVALALRGVGLLLTVSTPARLCPFAH